MSIRLYSLRVLISQSTNSHEYQDIGIVPRFHLYISISLNKTKVLHIVAVPGRKALFVSSK